jgi:hypothetical protein
MMTTTGVGSAPPPSRLLSGLYYPEDVNSRIAMGDGVGDGMSDLIQRDMVVQRACTSKNRATLNVMEDDVELVRLVLKTPVVAKHVRALLATYFTSDSDRLAGWIGRGKNAWPVKVWQRGMPLSKWSEDVQKSIMGQISVIM